MSKRFLLPCLGFLACALPAAATSLTIQFQNLSPEMGTWISPFWVGFHDGSFDSYDPGTMPPSRIARLAEDANTTDLMTDFTNSGVGQFQAFVLSDMDIPPLSPGETATMVVDIDGSMPDGRYLSFGAMVVPSNDAFVGNADPMAIPVFDGSGNFLPVDMSWGGDAVMDAGSEVNDEVPMNTAFFGQMTPDTGDDENGVIHAHPGYMAPGSGGVLDDPMFANADFTAPGYMLFRLTITENVASDTADQPVAFELSEAWPNPFNPSTTIAFSLAETAPVRLAVYNMTGQQVALLQDGLVQRGEHQLSFDASGLASGVYFASLQSQGFVQTRKLLLVK